MLFQELYKNPDFLGINIERNGSDFVVCVAYRIDIKWGAKTMSGLSGSYSDEYIFKIVVERGSKLDENTANQIFSQASILGLEYIFN